MTTATAPKKHRAIDRVALLEAQVVKLTASAIQGIKDATKLATAREYIDELKATLARIDERHAETVAGLERDNAELQHRLGIAVKANAAADETQPIDTETVQLTVATVQHLSALNPNADTVQLPITDPAHLPGAA